MLGDAEAGVLGLGHRWKRAREALFLEVSKVVKVGQWIWDRQEDKKDLFLSVARRMLSRVIKRIKVVLA